jgi:NitT/TauT family transport system substrate-binding protein
MKALVAGMLVLAITGACAASGGAAPSASPKAAASVAATATATAAPAPVTLKVGQVGGISDAAIYIADAKGYFKDQGITLQSSPFASAAQMVAPLGTGELQVGGGASSAGLFNAIGRGVGMFIVADKGNLDPGNGYEAIVVRKELAGSIKGPKDLKGRTVALSALDITPEVTLDTYLRSGGLTIKDVNVVTIPHVDMLQALKNGSIDAGLPIEPNVSRIVAAGVGSILTRSDAVTPGHQTAVVLFSEKFAQQREVAVRFMKAYIQGARFYTDAFVKKDAAKRTEAVAILAKATNIDAALFDTMVMPGINPAGKVNLDSLTSIENWFVAKGSQQKFIDLGKAVDPSFADEAVKQLGPYK